MLREDFVIQTNIRRILIRSNIDYSEITFGTVKGVVYIQGNFRITGIPPDLDYKDSEDIMARTLRSLEAKIRSIPGVVDLNFQFRNWKKEKGQWKPTKLVE